MACVAIDEILAKETGRIGGEIYTRAFRRSFWLRSVRQEVFPAGMGDTINNYTQERSAPTSYGGWTDVTFENGQEGGACLPPVEVVSAGYTLRNYNLQQKALESTDFCIENLKGAWQLRSQLDSHLEQLTARSRMELEFRFRHEYLRVVGKKVVVGAAFESEGTGETFNGISGSCPGGTLSQGILDKYYLQLLADGATGMGDEGGAPVLTLVTDAETSNALLHGNTNAINELLWGKPSELLRGIGVNRRYKNFDHVIDPYPIRYTCSGGTYTEVYPFINTAATNGTKAVINPEWLTAPYTVTKIYDPMVMINRVPPSVTNPGAGMSFGPVNYLGRWRWVNEYDRKCNPDYTIGFFRGTFRMGTETVHPERGVAFVHQRCDPDRGPTGCPTNS